MELIFHEDDYLVKTLNTSEELEAAFRLRYDVYCNELHWTSSSSERIEVDRYDDFSESIGVFDEEEIIIGHLRLTASPHPFMLENEFMHLIPKEVKIEKGPDTAEATRLCVRKQNRTRKHFVGVSELLFKGMYYWSLNHDVRYLVIVVDTRCFRHLRLTGLPVEQFGDFKTMPDGVKAALCRIDWERFEENCTGRKYDFFQWMTKCPVLSPLQLPQHAFC